MVVPVPQNSRFDPTLPSESTIGHPSRFRSVDMRNNFSSLSRANDLRCVAHDVPDLSVYVYAGAYAISSQQTLHFPGGNSSFLNSTAGGLPTQQKIFVLELDSTGALIWNTNGAWETPPVIPTPPNYTDQRIPLCEVLVMYNDADIIQDKITDVRPMINLGVGLSQVINPAKVVITATPGQTDFDTSSHFHFFPGQDEILVWSDPPTVPCGAGGPCTALLYRVVDIDYRELNDHTIRFIPPFFGFAGGERVVIWKIGISATPGSFAFNDLSDVSVANTNDSGDRGTALVPRNRFVVNSLTRVGSTATAVTLLPHTFQNGDTVAILGADSLVCPEYNGAYTITFVNPTTFTYSVSGTPPTPATGTIYAVGDIPSATNPYQTLYSHNLINHLTDVLSLAPVAAHLVEVPALSPGYKHHAVEIEVQGPLSYAPLATDVEAALAAVDTVIYSPFLVEHKAAGQHGPKVTISQTAADSALTIAKSHLGAGHVISVVNSGTGVGVNIDQSGSGNGLVVTKSAGDGSSVVIINNYDPCVGLYALQRGAGTAIRVDSSATSSNIISVLSTVSSTGNAIDINVKGSGGTGGGFGIHVQQRGEAQALYLEKVGTGVVDCMHVANEGFGAGIRVNQSNTSGLSVGIQVDQRGAGYCYYANKLHGGADPAIAINNAGTGKDIYGNGGNWTVDKLGNAAFGGNVNVGDNLQVNKNTYLGPSGGFLRIGEGPPLTLTLVGGGANYVVLTHTLHRVDCNGQGLRYIYTGSFGNTPPIGTVIMIAGPTNHNTLYPRTDVAGSNQSLNGNYGYATVLTYVWMGDLWYTVTYG